MDQERVETQVSAIMDPLSMQAGTAMSRTTSGVYEYLRRELSVTSHANLERVNENVTREWMNKVS
jgi:hypothetical protein